MSTALIIAGGAGKRSGQEVPKQFLTVNEKPIIIYTLEAFQHHPDVSNIVVVVIDGWQTVVETYARQFGISKLSGVVVGGSDRFNSMYNGIKYLQTCCPPDEVILCHDANRPLVSKKIIDDAVEVCCRCGNALPAMKTFNSIYVSKDGKVVDGAADREILYRGQAPEAMRLGDLIELSARADAAGKGNTIAGMLNAFGEKVYLSPGSERNFKITTPDDIDMFKAMIALPETTKVVAKQQYC